MQNVRGYSKQFPQMPPSPQCETPANDPAYEVIEFSQQYTNTALPRKVTKSTEHKQNVRKCDLCGSSSAQFQCELCAQQTFCVSCDQMYHRHPKRQTHIRKKIQQPAKENVFEPPLPPKNELSQAPVPPPRRNKRTNRISTPSPTLPGTFKKNGSLMGSLKRFMGGMQTPSHQPRYVRSDSKPQKFPHTSQQIDFDQQSTGRDSGYLDWETDSKHRSSSFSTFNRPVFPGLTQAQSMAQLNCPSCHVHNVPPWDWSRSHMNLHAFQPWAGLTPGNPWHGSMMFANTFRMPGNEQFTRRGSFQSHSTPHRTRKFEIENDSESDLSVSDDRKPRKPSPPMARNVSPTMSRRSRKTVQSDSEDDIVSRKGDRKYKRRTVPMSREPSPALSRYSYRRKYDDEDAMSTRSVGSRRNLKPVAHKPFLRKNATPSSSDSDDELTSEMDGNENKRETISAVPDPYQAWQKRAVQNSHSAAGVEVQKEILADQNGDWACRHCTYINEEKLRVCKMCCKSKTCLKSEDPTGIEENRLEQSMKKLNLSTTNDERKGDAKVKSDAVKKTTSTGTSPPSQTISTQTYEVPNYVGKRNRSFTCDDYSDWNPVKKSNSTVSCSSDKQSTSIKQESIPSSHYIQGLLQNDTKQGTEIVKLLREAELHQFEIDDVAAALAQCGDTNPIKWLLNNWNKMIDTVVTLATNYGREQSENIIGTISSVEAQAALRLHHGDVWAAATECIRQRQKKYAKLMSKGNFSREDVVTVLTANHGDMEAAYMELNKTQLKPFLMKIWGPPQGLDNDSGNLEKSYITGKECTFEQIEKFDEDLNCFSRVQTWLETAIDDIGRDEIENKLKQSYYYGRLNNEYHLNGAKFKPLLNRYNSFDNLRTSHLNGFKSRSFCNSLEVLNPRHQSAHDNFAREFLSFELYADSVSDGEEKIRNYFINKLEKENVTDSRNENGGFDEERGDKIEKEMVVDDRKKNEGLERNTEFQDKMDECFDYKNVKLAETESECYDSADDLGQECGEIKNCRTDDAIQMKENVADVSKEVGATVTDKRRLDLLPDNLIDKGKKYLSFLRISLSSIPAFTTAVESSKEEALNGQERPDEVLQPSKSVTADKEVLRIDSVPSDQSEYFQTVEEMNSALQKTASSFNHQLANIEAEILSNSENKFTSENRNTTEVDDLLSELKALYLLAKCRMDFHVIEMKDSPARNTNYVKSYINDQSQNLIVTIPSTDHRNTETSENSKSKIENRTVETYENNGIIECESAASDLNVFQTELNDSNSERSVDNETECRDGLDENDDNKNRVNSFREKYETDANSELESEDESSYKEILESQMVNKITGFEKQEQKNDLNENLMDKESKTRNGQISYKNQLNQSRKTVNIVTYDVKPMFALPVSVTNHALRANKIFYEPTDEIADSNFEKEFYQCPDVTAEETQNNESFQSNALGTYENADNDNDNDRDTKIPHTRGVHIENMNEISSNIILKTETLQKSADDAIRVEETADQPEQITENVKEVYDKEEDDSFQARARRCLSEGLVMTYHQAELAVQLMDMKFERSQSVDAALECTSIQSAITYLQQECHLCAENLSMKQMISMLKCEHRCCQECARKFFSLQINEKSIDNCVCPFCGEPEISRLDSDTALNYFSNLDIMLKTILNPETHELFQRKLRDRTLMQDPNFKWCPKCSFGFIADLEQKRIMCPSCRSVSCAQCGNLWEKEHNERSCEQYKKWLRTQNDSNLQLSNYLEDYGVTCPKCATKFILVKGGCMHLTCTNCKFEFCSDCLKTFSMGANCKISNYCVKLGLHAHHPRNCLFYLRDKEPQELKQLLLENNIQLNLQKTTNQRCNVQLQKETEDGLTDMKCGAMVEEGGLCRTHYVEYLASLVRKNKIDPVVIFDLAEILQEFRRRGKSLPIRTPNTFEHEYRRYCIQIVKEEMPLD